MSSTERNPLANARAAAALREWIGLDADTIGRAAVERAVRQACHPEPVGDAATIADRLGHDAAFRDRLVEEVIVAESWFFRDPAVFGFLRQHAAARVGDASRGPLRILSVPCAAGEEPLSVAMALLDAGIAPAAFTIDAADVSRAALRRAGSGIYSANAFRGPDLGYRDRWFRPAGAGWEIAAAVRGQVHFSWGNLLDPGFRAGAVPYDIVLCRNLLIYLTADARRRAEGVLDRLLAADGVLVLGAAEPPILKGDWAPAAATSMFTLRRGAAVAAAVPQPAPALPPAAPPPAVDPPRPAVAEVLREAGRLANAGRYAEAIRLCGRHEAAAGPTADVSFLMAMLHQAAGDAARAEERLQKTLYLDPQHDEALLALALAAGRRGDPLRAEQFRQAAARALARKEGR